MKLYDLIVTWTTEGGVTGGLATITAKRVGQTLGKPLGEVEANAGSFSESLTQDPVEAEVSVKVSYLRIGLDVDYYPIQASDIK